MMRNNDEVAIRENIPDETAGSEWLSVDFTVPVIDNFGDMGFALSLAVSLLERHARLHIRFYSENRELFGNMLGGEIPERLSYFLLDTWKDSKRSELRCNFFGLKLLENELIGHENPKRILNFDYLQFHRGTGPSDPGIGSLHGTEYEIGGTSVTHIVPSPLPEGGGVVVPRFAESLDRAKFLKNSGLSDELRHRKWCSVFVYPETLERVLRCTERYPDWVFFVSGTEGSSHENIVYLPFLTLETHSKFLGLCDANIVRGENSLVSAMLAGKPFLWDIYREKNGAHLEKMADF